MPKYVIGSAVMLLLLFTCALFAPYLAPFDPHAVDVASKLMPPSQQHLLGTDQLGRDVLSRLLYGARYSLLLAVTISLLELSIGAVVGLVVGWHQGRLEAAFLWLADVVSAFPSFLLSLATMGILGQGIGNMILAIVLVEWLYYARLMVTMVKSAKAEPYVISAQTMGLSVWHILKKHILPFVYRPIVVLALMNIGNIILMISSFSFLGIGVQPNVTEWGMMLHDARSYFRTALWLMMSPGLAILVTVLAFNSLGDYADTKGWRKTWNG
ncbi:TPA: ABC transporter permease [Streptococcus equi subsp. zooepidemicus]|uniref:Binding-protein-dependent transport system membrane protein n=1 Tax=Streptococcus equi subsp. ruminatorum CECT 5772 TaxID=1051981 RepID=A0A922T7U5_9STRE|nr:ABC transporter permease [Streptococcus equi]KED04991.1 binding-protein-dependent transport system membrane protein [Streptococcus equi subsp. ruminatorum CECT 5772]HEL0247370.1 ABC transporter permease [Streptococcus equi subsp. zooepidemicus]HEL1024438.1 ABC transporter permease [Streptococcus equi subsp. ruminatorum CECT 5772]